MFYTINDQFDSLLYTTVKLDTLNSKIDFAHFLQSDFFHYGIITHTTNNISSTDNYILHNLIKYMFN